MTAVSVLRELWERRLLVAAAAATAAIVAVAAVYDLALAPPSISKQDHVEARGSIEILIDSAQSPIADVGRNLEPLTARAGVFSRYIAGGNVINRISDQTGIPAGEIEVAGPVPLPGEAVGAAAPPQQQRPYGIEVAQRDALPIVNVVSRAPTLEEARQLVAAVPPAVRGIVGGIQRQQEIPDRKRVTFRVLGPPLAQVVTAANGAKVALMIFLFLFSLLVLLILGLPRFIEAWWAAGPDHAEPHAQPQQLRVASIATPEDAVERPQLETPAAPHPGDG